MYNNIKQVILELYATETLIPVGSKAPTSPSTPANVSRTIIAITASTHIIAQTNYLSTISIIL